MKASQGIGRAAPIIGLAAALAAGAFLRLSFHTDIEWKGDEHWSFFHARQMLATGAWPPLGMQSSVGAPNPGLSLWVFAGLMALFGARSPPDLAQAVQTLNVAALVAFAAFGLFAAPRERREPWLWAAALWALNPVAVILERKIWPPSVLPIATVALVWAWSLRRHRLAAFICGALLSLMTQIHMGAAGLALALPAWTFLKDRRDFRWLPWLAGSVVGAAPALPWLLQMLSHGDGAHAHLAWPNPEFYLRWAGQPFGFGAGYTLGRKEWPGFLRSPLAGGAPSFLMAGLQAGLWALWLTILARLVQAIRRNGWPKRRALLLGDSPETLLVCVAFWGYGGFLTLVTLTGAGSYRHYMIVVAPIMALWAAMTVLWSDRGAGRPIGRALLVGLCVCEAAISLGLLAYIHHAGVIHGEFGASWRAQQPGFVAPKA